MFGIWRWSSGQYGRTCASVRLHRQNDAIAPTNYLEHQNLSIEYSIYTSIIYRVFQVNNWELLPFKFFVYIPTPNRTVADTDQRRSMTFPPQQCAATFNYLNSLVVGEFEGRDMNIAPGMVIMGSKIDWGTFRNIWTRKQHAKPPSIARRHSSYISYPKRRI